jgi:hypothetical protein
MQILQKIIRDVLTEAFGVPEPIHPYVELSKSFLLKELQSGEINNAIYISASKINEFGLSPVGKYGKEYMKFPIRAIQISFRIHKQPEIHDEYYITGAFVHAKSNLGNAIINDQAIKTWNIKIDCDIAFKNTINYSNLNEYLEGFLNHEMTHAYEFYNKAIKNKDSISHSSTLDIAAKKSSENENNIWEKFLSAIYFTLQYEINARIPELYAHIKSLRNKGLSNEEVVNALYQTQDWIFATQLQKFNHGKFLQKLEKSFVNSNQDPHEYLENKISTFQNDLLHLVKDASSMGKEFKSLAKISNMDPVQFLEYWEKVFHEKGNYIKKKMSRVLSYEQQK